MNNALELKEKGRRIDVKIDSVSGINIDPKWKITCSYYIDNKFYYFNDILNYNPKPIMEYKNIRTLPVYINGNNYKEYFLDTNIFLEHIGNKESL